ncbi:MAG: class B sortase [Erysipelotrichaceae bacterium]|nr:class B sortase [Erysipelotrichaceae bacterium]
MNENKQKTLIAIVSTITVLLLTFFALIVLDIIDLGPNVQPEPVIDVEPEPQEEEPNEEYLLFKEKWQENKKINEDYVGDIVFDSGIIDVSFVQAKSVYKENGEPYRFYTEDGRLVTDYDNYTGNDVYIWTYWKTGKYDYNDNGGSTFMDYRNTIYDQNLIIYGHHFSVWNDETRTKAFTPLELFLEQKNYMSNRYVKMILEKEIRTYVLAVVYEFDASQERFFRDMQYWRTSYDYDDYNNNSYDPGYYEKYIENIKKEQLYDTGVELTTADRTLTLQTCISGYTGELFEILVFKEVSVEYY